MIEKRGNFIITEALFSSSEVNSLEELGIEVEEPSLEPTAFRFRIEHLSSYNEGRLAETTTIRLLNGEDFNLNISFKDFDDFIMKKEFDI